MEVCCCNSDLFNFHKEAPTPPAKVCTILGRLQQEVCVESAVKRVKEDKDNYLVQYVRGVFKQPGQEIHHIISKTPGVGRVGVSYPRRMETSGTGVITWDDFQSSINSKDMKELVQPVLLTVRGIKTYQDRFASR